jgi:hypothetical protein
LHLRFGRFHQAHLLKLFLSFITLINREIGSSPSGTAQGRIAKQLAVPWRVRWGSRNGGCPVTDATTNPAHPGRPAGETERPDISLPNGNVLKPRKRLAAQLGMSERTLTRLRVETTLIAGVAYCSEKSALQIIAAGLRRPIRTSTKRRPPAPPPKAAPQVPGADAPGAADAPAQPHHGRRRMPRRQPPALAMVVVEE